MLKDEKNKHTYMTKKNKISQITKQIFITLKKINIVAGAEQQA